MENGKENMYRLYRDLAWLWPIWGSLDDYREESELFAEAIHKAAEIEVNSLLDMGCGGGKNAFHFKNHFAVTGIDISEAMLSHAKKLNPECTFDLGDMRTVDLNLQFDSVFINDSVVYMATEEDLLKAFRTAHRHLRAGGVMLVCVEKCKENFRQNQTTVSTFTAANMEITFVENNYDPDPKDDTYETTFVYLIREKGKLRIEHDSHICGLFSLDVWRRLLKEAGFIVDERVERVANEHVRLFVCLKAK